MRYCDLIRQPEGYVYYFECELERRNKLAQLIQSYCTRSKAKIKFSSINGFDMQHNAVYLLRCEVVKSDSKVKTND